MALRIRINGDIVCAAHTEAEEGDTYLHDGIHYYLSVLTDSIRASKNHNEDNLWFWNIKDYMLEHYAEINNNENIVIPRRKNKEFINISDLVNKKQNVAKYI